MDFFFGVCVASGCFVSSCSFCVCVTQLCPSLTICDGKSAITVLVMSQYVMYLSSLVEVFGFSFTLIFRTLKSLTNCVLCCFVFLICPGWCSLCFLDPSLTSLINVGKFSVISFSIKHSAPLFSFLSVLDSSSSYIGPFHIFILSHRS